MSVSSDVNRVVESVEEATTDSTAARYAGAIRVWAKWCDAEGKEPLAATPLDIEEYLRYLWSEDGKDYAFKTVSLHRSALTKFFDRAEALADSGRDIPDPREVSPVDALQWENPSSAMTLGDLGIDKGEKKTERAKALEGEDWQSLDPGEVEDMVNNVPSPVLRNELLCRLMYQCMLRRGEVARLKLEHIDRDRRVVVIPSEISKNGEERTVPWVTNRVDTLLDLWIESDREASPYSDSDYLFVTHKSGQMEDRAVSEVVRKAADNAGVNETLYTTATGVDISKVTGHELRRAGARRRWDNGTGIYAIKKLLGHESVETTKEYINAEKEQLIKKGRENWFDDD